MTPQEVLEAITNSMPDQNDSGFYFDRIEISPVKLAAFLAEHLNNPPTLTVTRGVNDEIIIDTGTESQTILL